MARELLAGGQRESAKVLIRRKRVLEAQVASTVAKLDAVENSLSTIEGTEMTEAVLEAVERGNKAVETLNARVTVERVENAMAADADAQAYVDEVSTALGLFDEKEACEEEVLADLAEFEKEHGIASATNTDTGVNGAVNGTKQTAVEEDADVITPVKQQVVEEEDVVTPVVEEEEDEDAIRPVVPKKRTAVPA